MARISNGDRTEWAEAVGRSFYPLALASAGERFEATIRQTALMGNLTVAEVTCAFNDLHRTPQLVREAPHDDVLLLVQLSGHSVVTQSDRRARLAAGSATLCDPLVEYHVVSGADSHQLVLMLPRATVRALAAPIASVRLRVLEPGSITLRALTAVCEEAVSQGDLHPADAETVSRIVGDLARAVFVGETRRSAPIRSREEAAARAKAFIRDAHPDAAVSTADIADAVGVSARTLGTLLRDEGGPSTLLRSARLRTAREMLADPGAAHLTIGDVASRSGFSDQTTFIRAFRREFSILPSEVRYSVEGAVRP